MNLGSRSTRTMQTPTTTRNSSILQRQMAVSKRLYARILKVDSLRRLCRT